MRKIFFELIVSVALLLGTWLLLSQIDWMKLFKVEQATKNTEEKVGDLFWDLLKKSETEINDSSIIRAVDSMVTFVSEKNHLDRKSIQVHILQKDEVNAFALPNNHLVVYSGLISECENQAELYGVLCHEMAHLEKNHVMNKLVKEIGLSVLISISTGNSNSEVIKRALKQLSSSAYDRSLETEADLTAVEYLMNAGIDPQPFANFLYRLSDQTKDLPRQIFWISTHPESKERAEEIIREALKHTDFKPIKTDSVSFMTLKETLSENKW